MFSPFTRTAISREQMLNNSVFSPSVGRSLTPNCSRNSSFGVSFRDSFLGEHTNHMMEPYGLPLPVFVTEAINIADRVSDLSVKLETFGYASLVCGRQLFIWKYKEDPGGKSLVHCKELMLPPSDLAHKADLVHLFQTKDSILPSALAVSPEGHVRYWPNINHEGSSVDAQPDLQGQECYSLTSAFPVGCILATTTSSLIIITPTIGEGQPNVTCRPLSLPLGMLAGIGRKMSSFIFGVVPAQNSETKQLRRIISVKDEYEDSFLYVLSSCSLQKWHITKNLRYESADQLLFEIDVDRQLKQMYINQIFNNDTNLLPHLKTWCLDIQLCQSGVILLTCGTVLDRFDGNMHYALAILDTNNETPPENFSAFHIPGYTESYQVEHEEKLLDHRLLLPSVESQAAYIYASEKVLCVQFCFLPIECSEMNFVNSGNVIFGSGSCDGTALFFTKDYGIISFLPSQKSLADTRLIASMKDASMKQSDSTEDSESLSAKLRAAMFTYCNGDTEKCEKSINEVLLSNQTDLDEAVLALSVGIIDDFPVSDPRWCESVPSGSVSSSLIISYQLEDKLKVHDCLINFLKNFKILNKLSTSKINEYFIPTSVLLCEHAEKLAAAKAVRLFLTEHSDVIEIGIQYSLSKRNIEVKTHLTPQDVFFREVSSFHTLFGCLIDWETEKINEDESLSQTLHAILTVNKIFIGLLEAIDEYRQSKKDTFDTAYKVTDADFAPWTSRDGESGIRSYIQEQLNIITQYAMSIIENIQIQGTLYQQFVEILDFYLDSYKIEISHSKNRTKKVYIYNEEKSKYLKKLLSVDQYERAAYLAEKHLEFDILIQICEETKNGDRMQRYILQFSEQKFSEFLFKWYLEKGKKGKIFDKHLGEREVLGGFLQEHDSLKWLYYIQEEKFDAAHFTLKQLAMSETQFLNRKKTLLSLSKLCAMVSDVSKSIKCTQIEDINLEQDLIAHQEALPISVVEACGIDPGNMRVFPPEELIEMYIAEENTSSNAYDFKIALDLLSFIKKPSDDPDICSLRIHIWSKAILKDSWETLDINNPVESVKETIFFQIIELAYDHGVEIHDFMPSLDDLLQAPDLRDLAESPSFKFLLQASYEHILKIIA